MLMGVVFMYVCMLNGFPGSGGGILCWYQFGLESDGWIKCFFWFRITHETQPD
jgi:hypothetical protein